MGEKRRKLYKYISSIAAEAVDNLSLNERVLTRFPDVSNKQIMKASLLAFTDRQLSDQAVFAKICDLAISKRSVEVQDLVTAQTSDPEAGNESVTSSDHLAPMPVAAGDQEQTKSTETAVIKLAKPRPLKQKTPPKGISPN